MLHYELQSTQLFKGGAPKPPKPPLPPAPTAAAENYAKSDSNLRQRRARGFGASILGGYASAGQDRPQGASLLKSLMGQ